MKVPRYIKDALSRRAYYGELVNKYDTLLSEWIKSQGVSSDIFEPPYEINSVMLITEPYAITDKQIKILEELK